MPIRSVRIASTLALVGASLLGGIAGSALLSARAVATMPAGKPEAMTVATVDLTVVIKGLDEAGEARTRLQKVYEEYNKQIDDVKSQMKKVDDDLAQVKDGTSAEALTLRAKKVELQALGRARAEGLQGLIDVQEGELMREMFVKITSACQRLGKEQGYDLVFTDDRTNMPPEKDANGKKVVLSAEQINSIVTSRRLLAVADRVDITQQLITFMNNEFKAGKK